MAQLTTTDLDIEALIRRHTHLRTANERVNVLARKSDEALVAYERARDAYSQAHHDFIEACRAAHELDTRTQRKTK